LTLWRSCIISEVGFVVLLLTRVKTTGLSRACTLCGDGYRVPHYRITIYATTVHIRKHNFYRCARQQHDNRPMAPRVANTTAADSESEDDLAAAAAISSVENRRIAQNTLAATKFGKAMRRNSTTKAPIKRKATAAKQSRQALKDRTNYPEDSDNEQHDNAGEAEMDNEEPKPKTKRARTTAASKKKAAAQAASDPVEDVAMPAAAAKRTRTAKRVASPEPSRVIPDGGCVAHNRRHR
jgi:hypothetical protein